MSEEERAVLAAVARMEEAHGGPIDEYTVARTAGILDSDMSGQEYVLRPERERIRQIFDALENQGMLRIDRSGYWRPRTTLAGRRALQAPPPPTIRRPAAIAPAPAGGAIPAAADEGEAAPPAPPPAWPAWWPEALRFGEGPTATPFFAAIAAIAAIILAVIIVAALRGGGGGITPTATAGVPTLAAAASPAAPTTSAPAATATPRAATPARTTTAKEPTEAPTATLMPLAPTATPLANPPTLYVAHTDNQGAYLFATPNGERRFAISDGTPMLDIGPDEKDSLGRTWKHVRLPDYNNFEGWILAEYTATSPDGP